MGLTFSRQSTEKQALVSSSIDWTARARKELNRDSTSEGRLIKTEEDFWRAYTSLELFLPPFVKTGFRSAPQVRPFVSQLMRRLGQEGKADLINQFREQGIDPLEAIFGAASGGHRTLVSTLIDWNSPVQAREWAALGYLVRGYLTMALDLEIRPNLSWFRVLIQNRYYHLLGPLLIALKVRTNSVESLEIPRDRCSGVTELENQIGRELALEGQLDLAKKYGYEPTQIEVTFFEKSDEEFLEVLGESWETRLVAELIIRHGYLDLLPKLLELARQHNEGEHLINQLFGQALDERRYELLAELPLPRNLTSELRLKIERTYDRDILEWYLQQPGVDHGNVIWTLKIGDHHELVRYLDQVIER